MEETHLAAEQLATLRSRLEYWEATYPELRGIATADKLSEAALFLDVQKSPMSGVSVSTTPGRYELYKQFLVRQPEALLLAAMAQYRCSAASGTGIETNGKILPQLNLLVELLQNPTTSHEARSLACAIVLEGSRLPVTERRYPNQEQHQQLVATLKDGGSLAKQVLGTFRLNSAQPPTPPTAIAPPLHRL
jgi:hypothetical protein